MKKTNYDIIDIICGIVIVLVGIYLTFGIVVAIMGGIQAISGRCRQSTKLVVVIVKKRVNK